MHEKKAKTFLLAGLAFLIVGVIAAGPFLLSQGPSRLAKQGAATRVKPTSAAAGDSAATGAGETADPAETITPAMLEALGKKRESTTTSEPSAGPLPEISTLKKELLERAAQLRSVREEVHLTGKIQQNGAEVPLDQTFFLDYYPQTGDMVQMVQDREGRAFRLVKKEGHYYTSTDLKSFVPYDEKQGKPVVFHYPDFVAFLQDEAMSLSSDGKKGEVTFTYSGDDSTCRDQLADLFGLDARALAQAGGADVDIRLTFGREKGDLQSGFIACRTRGTGDKVSLRYDFTFSNFNNLRMLPAQLSPTTSAGGAQ